MEKFELIENESDLFEKINEINNGEFKDSQVAIITNNVLEHPDFEQGEFSGYRPAFCSQEPGLCDFNPNSKIYYKNFASESIEQFIKEFNDLNVLNWGSTVEIDYADIVDKSVVKEKKKIDANDRIDWTRESIIKVKKALEKNIYVIFVNDRDYYKNN